MSNELVSIIIPVYNRADYLEECLGSIRGQTWKELEVIVIDDGSTDRSSEIIQKYVRLDSRFHLFTTEHKGPSGARNKGIDAATGTFLTFVDADDFIGRDYVRNMAEAIGDSDFCIAGYQVWDQEQNKRRTIKPVSGSFTLTEMGKNIFRYESVLRGVAWKLVRRSVVTEHKLFFPPEVRYAEDTLFYFKYLSCIETFVVIRDAQYVYRKHNQESLVKTSYQEITLIEAFFKELEKLYIEAPQINLRNLIACWQVLNLWEFGRCACYRTRGFQKRKRLFYEIVRRYDIKRKCRQVRCISVPCSAVRLTVLSNTFLPFNLFIRAAGRVMQWDKQFV